MSNRDWVFLIVGLIFGVAGGGYVGARWQYWLDAGWQWLISICAAVGIVCVIVGGVAVTNGWRP